METDLLWASSTDGFEVSDRFAVITYRPLNALVIPLFILLEIEVEFKPNYFAACAIDR